MLVLLLQQMLFRSINMMPESLQLLCTFVTNHSLHLHVVE